nr:hypothetical protein CFP56_43893 [Quercus suber]
MRQHLSAVDSCPQSRGRTLSASPLITSTELHESSTARYRNASFIVELVTEPSAARVRASRRLGRWRKPTRSSQPVGPKVPHSPNTASRAGSGVAIGHQQSAAGDLHPNHGGPADRCRPSAVIPVSSLDALKRRLPPHPSLQWVKFIRLVPTGLEVVPAVGPTRLQHLCDRARAYHPITYRALQQPRLPPIQRSLFCQLTFHISVFGAPRPISVTSCSRSFGIQFVYRTALPHPQESLAAWSPGSCPTTTLGAVRHQLVATAIRKASTAAIFSPDDVLYMPTAKTCLRH